MALLRLFFASLFPALFVSGRAPPGAWDAFNYAPTSKTVYPAAIHSVSGSVQNAQRLVHNGGSATITGQGSWVALDYGIEVRIITRAFSAKLVERVCRLVGSYL